MTACVGVFSAKSRTKSVDFRKSHSKNLTFQLATYSKASFFSKKILTIINTTIKHWRRTRIQSGNLKNFTGSLTIISGNYRSMEVNKSLVLKKFMNGIGQTVTHPHYRTKSICSRSQVSNFTQKFKGMMFFL